MIQKADTLPVPMARPTPHPKSGVYRLRRAIPANLRAVAKRLYGVERELIIPLGTKDRAEAKRLAPRFQDELERKMAAIRAAAVSPPQSLSHMQVHAVAGAWYREALAANEAEPGSREAWEIRRDDLLEALPRDLETGDWEDYEPTSKDIEEAEGVLGERGLVADTRSIHALAQALLIAKIQLAETMARRAGGDYRPDDYSGRYPTPAVLPTPTAAPASATPAVTVSGLVRGWAKDNGYDPEARPIPRNYYDRDRTARRLIAFLGYDNAASVTKAAAVRWKESMAGKSAATIANDLSEMSAVWKWGLRHGRVSENPFQGLLPPKKARRRKKTRRQYADAEAAAILIAARQERGFLRWLPWVLAATGARLSEVCQASKNDLIEWEGLPFLRIHADEDDSRPEDEAQRSVKNAGSVRMVPIHPRLIAEGFLTYVAALPPGSALFPDIRPDAIFGSRAAIAGKKLARWTRVKVGITATDISPAHSWRHWWIGSARKTSLGQNLELRHALTGHVDGENESHNYGRSYRDMPQALSEGMALIEFPSGI